MEFVNALNKGIDYITIPVPDVADSDCDTVDDTAFDDTAEPVADKVGDTGEVARLLEDTPFDVAAELGVSDLLEACVGTAEDAVTLDAPVAPAEETDEEKTADELSGELRAELEAELPVADPL